MSRDASGTQRDGTLGIDGEGPQLLKHGALLCKRLFQYFIACNERVTRVESPLVIVGAGSSMSGRLVAST